MISLLKREAFAFFLLAVVLVFLRSLFFPGLLGERIGPAIGMSVLLVASLNLRSGPPRRRFGIALFGGVTLVMTWAEALLGAGPRISGLGYVLAFVFLGLITMELFEGVLTAKRVTLNILAGALAGYLLIGFIGQFLFLLIELAQPGSFSVSVAGDEGHDALLYFSFVSLTTIGYGDITPITPAARKVAVLLGLLGQFYIAVIMAILVGLFLQHRSQ